MVNRTPLYAQLKIHITSAIASGELAPGDQLPSQRALAERHEASHMTVRRAIDELLHDGIIAAIPGKGLYVAAPKQQAESGPLVSFSDDMVRRGLLATSQILAAEIVGASALLAQIFALLPESPLVYLRRLRLADGAPMAIQTAFLPAAICPGLLTHDLASGSLYTLLRETYSLQLAEGHTTVEAALADIETAGLLGIAPPAPLLITEQITTDERHRPVEFVRSVYRGDRYRMTLAPLSDR